ncbi:rotatin-like [Anopheles albimanus]|uniref:Rotatin N-terminal domain-containing protein n=1 Tax=Anopheles albimanus TaxID=7167 RepID=A0A182FTD4_ANOAL|nr:rotatin-like [Anopheles albimanus]
MAIVINHVALEKLLHEIQEIRVRALHDIENKLKRALWENVDLCFNGAALFKNLIRWFGQNPICEEVTVLELMSLLLTSKYGGEIVQYFTADRILKELNKIRCLIEDSVEHDELLQQLMKQVRDMKTTDQPTAPSTASSIKSVDLTELTNSLGSLKLNRSFDPVSDNSGFVRSENDPTFYVTCWEVPAPNVASVLQCFNDSLRPDGDELNLQHALSFLAPYIQDYPPEFFLQPPYIFLSLLRLVYARKVPVRKTLAMLLKLLISLEKRMDEKKLSVMHIPNEDDDHQQHVTDRRKVQISVSGCVYELFQLCLELSKELSTDLDMGSSNMVFLVVFQLTALVGQDESFPAHRYIELRREMGYLIKHYRQEWESNMSSVTSRIRYLISLQNLLNFVYAEKDLQGKEVTALDHGERHSANQYNPADYAITLNSTGHRQVLDELDGVWMNELHLAQLDYSLQFACEEMYTRLWVPAFVERSTIVCTLASVREELEPAVLMLRNGITNYEGDEAELLGLAQEAMGTLHLHRSIELVRMIMKTVGNCARSMIEDEPVRELMESITLRLLAHGDEEIRCEAYELCTGMMKDFIGQLDEGAILTRRSLFSKTAPKLRSLGIPLSLEILTEITCFGYPSANVRIHRCAETMLLFLCNSRAFLHEKWTDVQEILLPMAPLLQLATIGAHETTLRKAVMGLFHPDCELPLLDVLQGNLRMLYHENGSVREEALTRVLFLLSSTGRAGRFMPRIENITDTIPNGLCLLKLRYDPAKHLSTDVHEVSAVRPLLDTLEQEDGDPGLRRSALVQLNVMAEDPLLCELIHNASGWPLVLKALYNALQENHLLDYPDAAIPAVGILTKLCFTVTSFRRFLGTNETAYELIVRSLLAFHHMPVFRVECCALLYLMLFADCSLGGGRTISLPRLCETSCFRIPFVCEFHWRTSPFRRISPLEELVLGENALQQEPRTSAPEGESILQLKHNTLSLSAVEPTQREPILRLIRFTFADLWFDGSIAKLLQHASSDRRSSTKGTQEQDDNLAPIVYGNEKSSTDGGTTQTLRFASSLRLTKQDLQVLKISNFATRFRWSLRNLAGAKSHSEVFGALAAFESNLMLPLPVDRCPTELLIKALKRFLLTPPCTRTDQQLLVEVISMVGDLIQLRNQQILDWMLELLSADGNVFFHVLRSENSIDELFGNVTDLLRLVLLMVGWRGEEEKKTQAVAPGINWMVVLFGIVTQQLDAGLRKCELSRLIPLMKLLRVLVERSDPESFSPSELIVKLLLYIRHIRSTSYTGSTIVRLCLIAIANLLEHQRPAAEAVRIEWKASQLKTLSTQCGHSSALARSCAWNVLAKISSTLEGASAIVKECAYLPGGIHASCLSTVLDDYEAALVKEAAAGLLVCLFSHRVGKDGPLYLAVQPVDLRAKTELEPQDPLQIVLKLLAKQRFFEESVRSLDHFTARDAIDAFGVCDAIKLITPEVVKAYAMIYRSLVELNAGGFVSILREKGCLQGLIDCVSKVPLKPTRPALLMVAEVCALLVQCMEEVHERRATEELLKLNQAFVGGITYLLDPAVYEAMNEDAEIVMQRTTGGIMRILCALAGSQLINCVLAQLDVKPIVRMIETGIRSKQSAYQLTCLKFVLQMVLSSDMAASSASEFPSFLAHLESIDMLQQNTVSENTSAWNKDRLPSEDSDEDDTENLNPNRCPMSTKDVVKGLTDAATGSNVGLTAANSGTGRIFVALLHQFNHANSRDMPGMNVILASTVERRTLYSTMQTLLRLSAHCRRVAWDHRLLTTVIDRFNAIYEELLGRMSYPEFVRRNGEAKKLPVVEELSGLISLLSAWFSSAGDVLLLQREQIGPLCRVVLQYWPWLNHNHELEVDFMRALAFLTESSIVVCKSLVATFSGYPHSILKLLIATVTSETGRVKGPKCDLRLLGVVLRVLSNCCSCQEGRSTIGKLNVIDNISKLHPSVTKLQKPWIEVTRLWLEFWEIYTRYSDVNEVRHLTVLGALFRKGTAELRLLSLAILRNLSFVPANRVALLSSADCMFMLQSSLQQTNQDKQLIAAVTIWKLIANNHKGKAAVKSSPLVRMTVALSKHYALQAANSTVDKELWNVLSTVRHILEA